MLFVGWAALHLRVLDRIFSLTLPASLKLTGIFLLVVGGVIVLLCGGMLCTTAHHPNRIRCCRPVPLRAEPNGPRRRRNDVGTRPLLPINFNFALVCAAASLDAHFRRFRGRAGAGEAVRRKGSPVQRQCKSLASDFLSKPRKLYVIIASI